MESAPWPEELQLPPPRDFDPYPRLSGEVRTALAAFVDAVNARLEARKGTSQRDVQGLEPLGPRDLAYVEEALETLQYSQGEIWTPFEWGHVGLSTHKLLTDASSFEPIQLIRLLILTHDLGGRAGITWQAEAILADYRKDRADEIGLRELAQLFEIAGLDSALVARTYLDSWTNRSLRWGPEATWPFFAERLDALSTALRGKAQQSSTRRVSRFRPDGEFESVDVVRDSEPHCTTNAFDALDCFPRVPPPLEEQLWGIAIGSAKTFRPRAQRLLQKEPGAFERAIDGLRDSRASCRAGIAAWLAEWRDTAAVPALRAALQREKHDVPRDALMTALESLGVPLDDISIPSEISQAASHNLEKKSVPSSLAWFPFDRLPEVRWAGAKDRISRETLVWWLIQANQLKSSEPGALLRRQVRLVHIDDREILGSAVLQAWIDYDTMPGTWEQVRQAAQQRRDMWLKIADFAPDFAEQIPPLDDLIQAFLQQPGGSAIRQKGLLAIAAACGGERSVQLAIGYIRKWYGIRAPQSKALVQLLSWIETPSSIQFLTATARSFRTKGIQDEAYKALQSLATRRGWTVDELADRMVSDAGLDEQGRIALDFGTRRFVAELDPAFRLQVRDSDGRLRQDLPKPGKSDDEAAAAEARQSFSKAKKQIRVVVKEQTDRLFCAMCIGRKWSLDDWASHLAEHPIVGRLCRQVVWRAEWPGTSITFRPRSAREWTDCAARPVDLRPEAMVSIAHDVDTTPDCSMPWVAHFEHYAIEPLFPQFNRGLPDLSELALDAVSIDDFGGWLIGAYALAAAARKLGYSRGGGIDGPTFYDYRRSFPSLRLEVHIESTGQDFYEADRPVALRRMTFWGLPDPASKHRAHRVLPLAEVPPVLLLESFRDLREIALAGEGYDPQWQEKSQP